MPNNLDRAEANRLLDATLGSAAFPAPTLPIRIALNTVTGTNTSAGTELSGGSYARQPVTFGAASGFTATNNVAVTFTNLPAAVITGIELYDSASTPRRSWVGALTASKTVVAGDSLSFGVSTLTITNQ